MLFLEMTFSGFSLQSIHKRGFHFIISCRFSTRSQSGKKRGFKKGKRVHQGNSLTKYRNKRIQQLISRERTFGNTHAYLSVRTVDIICCSFHFTGSFPFYCLLSLLKYKNLLESVQMRKYIFWTIHINSKIHHKGQTKKRVHNRI